MSSDSSPESFTGGCACGEIRYECAGKPIATFNCHCRDCQRASGSAFTAVVYVPAKAFRITKGSPRYHRTPSDKLGYNVRAFCPECGSRLFGGISDVGQGITASSLDDPGWFRPQFDIFTCDAQPWDRMDPALRKFEGFPATF
ncbi:MAG TPA: GFA family protein [Chthoniobacterales bacterium]